MSAMPEASEQVRDLTRSFVLARYSEHDLSGDQVSVTQQAWRRIKRALQVRRRQGKRATKEGSDRATQDD